MQQFTPRITQRPDEEIKPGIMMYILAILLAIATYVVLSTPEPLLGRSIMGSTVSVHQGR